MPSVLQSSLFQTSDESVVTFWKDSRMSMCKSAMNELGDVVEHCSVPSVDNIINATKEAPLDWNLYEEFEQSEGQSDESFAEQKVAIANISSAVDSFLSVLK